MDKNAILGTAVNYGAGLALPAILAGLYGAGYGASRPVAASNEAIISDKIEHNKKRGMKAGAHAGGAIGAISLAGKLFGMPLYARLPLALAAGALYGKHIWDKNKGHEPHNATVER